MSEHFNESDHPAFSDAIQANKAAAQVPADEVALHVGNTSAAVRLRGAYITRLAFEQNPEQDILYCAGEPDAAKLAASHMMMPVGPYDGAGGQHGFPRWAQYAELGTDAGPAQHNHRKIASLEAQLYDAPLRLRRTVAVGSASLMLSTVVVNQGPDIRTSYGEHLYFSMPEGATPADMRIGHHTIDDITFKGAAEKVAEGGFVFWAGYEGRPLAVTLPDKRLRMDTVAHAYGSNLRPEDVGMLIWKRKGKPFICLEPTVGYCQDSGGKAHNDNLLITRGSSFTVATNIYATNAQ